MRKCAFPLVLLLLHVIISAAAPAPVSNSGGGGPEKACQQSSDAKFCTELLTPYASQFMDNDTSKMGFAAISATLSQVQATRAFMVRQTTEPETTEKERKAVTECLGMVGNGDDNLRMATQEYDQMRAAKDDLRVSRRQTVIKMIDSARNDLSSCSNLLKNHTDLIDGRVIREAARLSDRSVQACTLSQAFIQ